MTYDQAQSPRLGQRTPVESTYVRMFSGEEIPEAAWPGQLIYRNETQGLQIFNGNAWEDVVGGEAGLLTFVGPTPPTSQHIGDIWFDSSDSNRIYVAASAGADQIAVGEWEDASGAVPPVTPTTYIYHQDTPPGPSDTPVPKDNDFWFETPGNQQYYYLSTAPGTHWVAVRDTGIQEALDAAAAAQSDVDNAISDLNTMQTSVDGKASTYFGASAPWADSTAGHENDAGDLWFDTDDNNKLYRWVEPGKTWTLSDDQRIGATITTVNGKITTYYQASIPTSTAIGDLWVDTDDSNQLYRAASVGATTIGAGQWLSVRDGTIAAAATAAADANTAAANAMSAAEAAQATADGAITTYYAADPPWANDATGHADNAGDMWFDTDTGQAYRWNDLTKHWDVIQDQAIGAALGAAQDAQTTADGKITAYYAASAPWANGSSAHDLDFGDLWYDTDDKNRPYYWDATRNWLSIQDGTISDALDAANAKIKTFYQSSPPTSISIGDLWVDTDDSNKLYRAAAVGVSTIGVGAWEVVLTTDLTPTAVPGSSPVIDHISASLTALGVVVGPVDIGTSIEYHISDTDGFTPTQGGPTMVLDSESLLGVIDHLGDNTLLALGTPYYVRVWAHNSLGYATTYSDQVSAQLSDQNQDAMFIKGLETDKILAGSLTVGQIKISAAEGIEIGPGGSLAHFPADATDIDLTAKVDAVRLNVRDELTVSGAGTIYGDLGLNGGVVAPTTSPTLTGRWVTVSPTAVNYSNLTDFTSYTAGLIEKPGDSTQLAFAQWQVWITDIRFMAKSDGSSQGILPRGSAWGSYFYGYGGLAYVGTITPASYYVLGQDGARNSQWFLYRINASTGAKVAERLIGQQTFFPARPALFYNSDTGLIGVAYSNPNFMTRYYNATSLADVGSAVQIYSNPTTNMPMSGAFYGNAGTGDNRFYLAVRSASYNSVLAFTNLFSSAPTYNFVRGGWYLGMTYDSAAGQMVAYNSAGTLYRHGKYPTLKAIHAKMSWYDGDSGGTGEHETLCGPELTSFNLSARQYLQISTPAPPDAADDNTEHLDRANLSRVYVENATDAAGTWYQATLSAATNFTAWKPIITEWTVDTPDDGSPPAFPESDFPGVIDSDAIRTGANSIGLSQTHLDGLGGVRLDGLVPPGCIMMYGGAVAPPGWLSCVGQSVLIADYPDLYDVIGTTFGQVDGDHFTLPNLVSRFAFGGIPGTTGGSSLLPSHQHGNGSLGTSTFSHTQATNTSSVDGTRNRLTSPIDHSHTITGATDVPSSSPSILPPYLTLRFIIRAL